MVFVGAKLYGVRQWLIGSNLAIPAALILTPLHSPLHTTWSSTSAVARCHWSNDADVDGPAPHESHQYCGLYASWWTGRDWVPNLTTVTGIIEAEGKVIPADYGFRCEKATIRALFIPESMPQDLLTSILAKHYNVPVFTNVGRFFRFCEELRSGATPMSWKVKRWTRSSRS